MELDLEKVFKTSVRKFSSKASLNFQKQGYRILHFTGKKVTDDPFTPASEALSILLDEAQEDILAHIKNYKESVI